MRPGRYCTASVRVNSLACFRTDVLTRTCTLSYHGAHMTRWAVLAMVSSCRFVPRVFLIAALVTSVLAATPAYAFRLKGIAQSDSGPYVAMVMRVHEVGPSLVGRARCIGQCLSRRYRVGLTFAADGSFTGSLSSKRTLCTIAGNLVGITLEGRYACVRGDGASDTGSFLLTR